MKFKVVVISLLCCFVWVTEVFGVPASYSNAYFQTGSDYFPLEYIQYGEASFSPYAQLAAAPIEPVAPYAVSSSVSCGSACFPQPLAKIEAYPSAKVLPVIVASKEIPNYEYSYVVHDENTGDQKVQKELSDGSIVRGQYSFLQPDGYVREVHYTADDLSGFNAVVKSFLPYAQKEHTVQAVSSCNHDDGHGHEEHAHGEETGNGDEHGHVEEHDHGEEHGNSEEHSHGEEHGHGEEHAHGDDNAHGDENGQNEEHHESKAPEEHHEPQPPEEQQQHSNEVELLKEDPKNSITIESLSQALLKLQAEVAEEQAILVTLVKPEEKTKVEPEEESTLSPEVEESENKEALTGTAMISYDNILKCIQAAIDGSNAPKPSASPLTYIIVPKNPC